MRSVSSFERSAVERPVSHERRARVRCFASRSVRSFSPMEYPRDLTWDRAVQP